MKTLTIVASVLAVLYGSNAEPAPKNRPVSKVLNLLKDMQTALAHEQDTDEGTYHKLQCWCQTNDSEKTKEIAEAEEAIAALTHVIEESAATVTRLQSEIKELEAEIASNNAALEQATEIRNKERNDFEKANTELVQALTALKAAVTVLSKNQTPPSAALINIATVMKHTLHMFGTKMLTHDQRRLVTAFFQEPANYIGASPTFKAAYGTQSSEIFGILENMISNFGGDQKAAFEEEAQKQAAFEAVKSAKLNEIAAAQASKDTKSGELADTQAKLAQAKQDIKDTRESLGADQLYLIDLKQKCQQTDAEWAERQKTRVSELEAVSKAIAILGNDDAHDLFTKHFNKGSVLLQAKTRIASRMAALKRARASSIIRRAALKAATETEALNLLEVASAAKLDTFERVKAAIDMMVSQLKVAKNDEIVQKDWCLKEINENERQTEMKNRDKTDANVKLDTLNQQISLLTKEIDTINAEIADLNKQLEIAASDRKAAHEDFSITVRDAQETQKLLAQAVEVLRAYYAPKQKLDAAALFQQTPAAAAGPPPPAGFSTYKNQNTSVITMLEQILTDSQNLQKEAEHAEKDSVAAYDTFVKDITNAITTKQRGSVDRAETKAVAEADLTSSNQDLAGVNNELTLLSKYASQVHGACDFVLKNFEARQTARDQEVDALTQAKAILSGMQSA